MIEREWKWDIDPAAKGVIEKYGTIPITIHQAYVHPDLDIRVRRTLEEDGFSYSELTVKIGKGEVREEVTSTITDDQAVVKLFSILNTIHKTRYHADGFEIDVYHNPHLNGLVTMEYELTEGEETPPPYPEWIAGFVKENVTDNERFKNRCLAIYCEPVSIP